MLYRPWQAVLAPRHLTPTEMDEAISVASGLRRLFTSMSERDQAHAFRVYRRVRLAVPDHPHAWQAALLHDCGKADSSPNLWHRVAGVLTARPPLDGMARRLLGRRYRAYRTHEALSVRLLREAGAAEPVWRTVLAMSTPEVADPVQVQWARAIREADNRE
ncbi:MAG: hypothetical protein ACYDAY_05030 [Candidatus Dormibacteria bacterium]